MRVESNIRACRNEVRAVRAAGATVGLVPTMGALHDGHVALMRRARERTRYVAVTIFVNPTQFAPGEDFGKYPRNLDADLEVCRAAEVDLVFTPNVAAMYGSGTQTLVHVAALTEGLCGPFRPGHFDGVATVVAKLFHILPADVAFFGEKDYQQLAVIRRMVTDLNISVEIVACPTVREHDGLAMSSRNAYLSPAERRQAGSLSAALFAAVNRVAEGQRGTAEITRGIREAIVAAGPCRIDYIEVVDAQTLARLAAVDRPARICLAVHIGSCRLLDNVAVDAATAGR